MTDAVLVTRRARCRTCGRDVPGHDRGLWPHACTPLPARGKRWEPGAPAPALPYAGSPLDPLAPATGRWVAIARDACATGEAP